MTEHFRDYLYYAPKFVVYTDNNPLTYVISTAKFRKYLNKWHQLHIDKKNGMLYHNQQVVLPKRFRRLVYQELREEMGHLGVERVLDLARQRFYWPNMRKDIDHFIHRLCRCLKQKQPDRHTVAPLQVIVIPDDIHRLCALGTEFRWIPVYPRGGGSFHQVRPGIPD